MDGHEIRELRTGFGLTQTAMAGTLEVSANTVARWEKDQLGISPAMHVPALLLALLLGIGAAGCSGGSSSSAGLSSPAEQPDPPQVAQPDPPQVAQPDPPQVAQPDPPQVAQPDPPQVAQPDPLPVTEPVPADLTRGGDSGDPWIVWRAADAEIAAAHSLDSVFFDDVVRITGTNRDLVLDVDTETHSHGMSPNGWEYKHTEAGTPTKSMMHDVIWYETTHVLSIKYFSFGTWIGDMDPDSGHRTLHRYYSSHERPNRQNIQSRTGSATWRGHSLGFYLDDGSDGSIYRFRSNLVVNVDLGNGSQLGSLLSGTLDNFIIEGSNESKDWVLDLGQAGIDETFTGAVSGSMDGGYDAAIVKNPHVDKYAILGSYEASNADGEELHGVFGAR